MPVNPKYAQMIPAQIAAEADRRMRATSDEILYKTRTVMHHTGTPGALAKIEAELRRRGLPMEQA